MSAIVDPPGGPPGATPPTEAPSETPDVDAGSRAGATAAPAAADPVATADPAARAHAARAGDPIGTVASTAAPGGPGDARLEAIAADLDAGRIDGAEAVARILDQAGLDVAAATSPALRERLVAEVRALAGDDPHLAALSTHLDRAAGGGARR